MVPLGTLDTCGRVGLRTSIWTARQWGRLEEHQAGILVKPSSAVHRCGDSGKGEALGTPLRLAGTVVMKGGSVVVAGVDPGVPLGEGHGQMLWTHMLCVKTNNSQVTETLA